MAETAETAVDAVTSETFSNPLNNDTIGSYDNPSSITPKSSDKHLFDESNFVTLLSSASFSSSAPVSQVIEAESPFNVPSPTTISSSSTSETFRCLICLDDFKKSDVVRLDACKHVLCHECLTSYLSNEITQGRTRVRCPDVSCRLDLSIAQIEKAVDAELFSKFDRFSLSRYLRTNTNVRCCPGAGCDFAMEIEPPRQNVIQQRFFTVVNRITGLNVASSMTLCKSSNAARLTCLNPQCGIDFCFYCQAKWHPDLTCEENRLVLEGMGMAAGAAGTSMSAKLGTKDDAFTNVKPCPRCKALIYKIEDGSCNHVKCTNCGVDFCWLCLKEVNDLHFFSPSGCTFFAKESWSTKRKIATQIASVAFAPVGVGVIAAIGVPIILIGLPVYAGRRISRRYSGTERILRLSAAIPATIVASPIVAAAAVTVGVPLLLTLAYVVFPGYLLHENIRNKNNKRKLGLIPPPIPVEENSVQ